MVPPTRRSLLGAVGLLAATAGCGGRGRRDDTATPTVAADPDRTIENSTESGGEIPPTLRLRGGEEVPPIRRPSDERRRRRPLDDHDWDVHSWVLDREATESLRVASDGREAVQSFLADTDFETETVYVQSMRVSACHTVTLCSVSWAGDGVETDYGRRLKPHTAACEADSRVYESRLIRIPAKIDDGGGYSTSLGGNACRGAGQEAGAGHHEDGDGHHGSETDHHGDGHHGSGTDHHGDGHHGSGTDHHDGRHHGGGTGRRTDGETANGETATETESR